VPPGGYNKATCTARRTLATTRNPLSGVSGSFDEQRTDALVGRVFIAFARSASAVSGLLVIFQL
jgi:hypothetical protein